jgi:hypothetical protein
MKVYEIENFSLPNSIICSKKASQFEIYKAFKALMSVVTAPADWHIMEIDLKAESKKPILNGSKIPKGERNV